MAANGAKSGQAAPKAPKKKAAKAADRTVSPSPLPSPAPEKTDAQDDPQAHPLIREAQKSIRNVNKKLANASKTDALVSEHSDKSLDELIAARIINADQKAQILKKPGLKAQLAQLEDQLSQLKKVDADARSRVAADKADLEKTLTEKLEGEKAAAVTEVKEKAEAALKKKVHDAFLVVSQFLRLAAARRAEEADQSLDENAALEGALLAVYSGDESAVSTMHKLVEGAEEPAVSTAGEQLQTTFADIKAAAGAYKPPFETVEDDSKAAVAESDPTMTNASATEIAAGDTEPAAAQVASPPAKSNGVPPTGEVTNEAANAAAESHWDAGNDTALSMSQEWVSVPRNPAETEAGVETTPAAPANTQSWADDHPDPEPVPAEAPGPATDPNDGFQSVQRKQSRADRGDRGDGPNWRGRGGQWRGRGRGEGRGRGRGGPRGGVAHRGARREEA